MINWDKELEKIFADPLLADVTAPRKRATSGDRLIAGFQEIEPSDSVWAGEERGSEWKWILRNAKMFKKQIPYRARHFQH